MTTVSGSATGVGRQATLTVQQKGEIVSISLSGTYNMTIRLEREVGSPGSGAWERVGSEYEWSTEDATVAATYVTREHNERLALNVVVDTSGTVDYSYSDGDFTLQEIKDDYGNVKATRKQSGMTEHGTFAVDGATTLTGAVTVTGALTATTGLSGQVNSYTGPAAVANASGDVTVTAGTHSGAVIYITDADGSTYTLPAATGSGNKYTFVLGAALSSGSTVITCSANGADFIGTLFNPDTDAATTNNHFAAGANDNTITLNGTSTGGELGDWLEIHDVAANVYHVRGVISQNGGAEATPFSTV